jgi:uncharacterized membrane protein YgcG
MLGRAVLPMIEPLEGRTLLSASILHSGGSQVKTIEFSQAPTAVQTGLDNLATSDNLTAPTATQTVTLSNVGGVEEYTIDITGTGTDSKLTVDQSGAPVTAPTKTTTTFGAITNTAVTNEITAIATALNLTAPASSTSILVTTSSGGASTYTVTLSSSSSTHLWGGTTFTVDSSGNPVGNINLPFSVMLPAVQTGLNNAAPAGATALSSTSTQTVQVRTIDGVTTYSTTFTTTGTQTTVTVNSAGTLTNLPSTTTEQYQNIPSAAQTELAALATDNGYTATISATQSVSVYDEANGTTIYSVTLPVSKTGKSGNTYTIQITVASDQNGNPTVPPNNNGFGGGGGGGGFGGGGCDGGGGSGGGGGGGGGGGILEPILSRLFGGGRGRR